MYVKLVMFHFANCICWLIMTKENKNQENKFNNIPKKKHGLIGRARPPEVRAKISAGLKGKPKKFPSFWKGKTGSAHPAYKHGKGGTRDYDAALYGAWIASVKKNYNYKCFVTQATEHLQCHHLRSWDYVPGRYDPGNGLLITEAIHKTFHQAYGSGQNTREQMEHFLKEQYQITEFPWQQGNHKPSLAASSAVRTDKCLRFKINQKLLF